MRTIARRNRRRGYTIIELLIVAMMLSIFAGMAVFSLGSGAEPEAALRLLARQMAGAMESAYNSCQITNAMVVLRYDLDEQTIGVLVARELKEGESPLDYDEEDMLIDVGGFETGDAGDPEYSKTWMLDVDLYSGERFERGIVDIVFEPGGSSFGHMVHLTRRPSKDGTTEEFSVEMNPLSGVAKVHQTYVTVLEPEDD